ncbi:hypothetical protein N9X94_03115 [Planktomarina temperata]|nr:hypothetical protein [Planktomarina temperata]
MKTKSDRNSTAVAVEQAQEAKAGLQAWPDDVPLDLAPDDQHNVKRIFSGIMAERAPSGWSSTDISRAAHLAVYMHLLGRDLAMLAKSGTLIRDDKGKPKANPLLHPLEKLQGSITQLCRALGLQYRDGAQDPRDRKSQDLQFSANHGRALAGTAQRVSDAGEVPTEIKGLFN